nr:MAG TPA: hypothetical protein [Caudoviricetes sp.]
MRSVRGTHPGKHTPGGRDRGPGCAPAPCEGRGANLLFLPTPRKDGAVAERKEISAGCLRSSQRRDR